MSRRSRKIGDAGPSLIPRHTRPATCWVARSASTISTGPWVRTAPPPGPTTWALTTCTGPSPVGAMAATCSSAPRYSDSTSRTGPSLRTTPPCSHTARSLIPSTAARSCDTNTSVVPWTSMARIRSRQRCWNAVSPTASTSSTSSTSGSRKAATPNPSRICMPLE